jgi:hypothetical protein
MKYLNFGFSLALILTGTVAMSAGRVITTGDLPDLSEVDVTGVTMAGTGCIDGSGASVYFDGESLVVEALEIGVVAGAQHRRSDSRESCQFIVDLNVPAGWTYAIENISGGTNTILENESLAQADFASWYGASSETSIASLPITTVGESSEDFAVNMESVVYAPCDATRSLKFKMALRVDLGTAQDAFAAAEFNSPVTLGLQWKRCSDEVITID